jgi:hypothetical protein
MLQGKDIKKNVSITFCMDNKKRTSIFRRGIIRILYTDEFRLAGKSLSLGAKFVLIE